MFYWTGRGQDQDNYYFGTMRCPYYDYIRKLPFNFRDHNFTVYKSKIEHEKLGNFGAKSRKKPSILDCKYVP